MKMGDVVGPRRAVYGAFSGRLTAERRVIDSKASESGTDRAAVR